jgi:hypothetical protein
LFNAVANTYIRGNITNNTGTTLTTFIIGTMNSSASNASRLLSLGIIGTADYLSASYCDAIGRNYLTSSVFTYRNSKASDSLSITYDTPFLIGSMYDGTNMRVYVNGIASTDTSSTGNFNYVNYEIGNNFNQESTQSYAGYIAEVIVYHSSLTTTQRQQIEGYLAWKWGLQSKLPSSHPYSLFPPS